MNKDTTFNVYQIDSIGIPMEENFDSITSITNLPPISQSIKKTILFRISKQPYLILTNFPAPLPYI